MNLISTNIENEKTKTLKIFRLLKTSFEEICQYCTVKGLLNWFGRDKRQFQMNLTIFIH